MVAACDPALAAARREARKIGSIGIHVSRGVSTHGLAINVNNDLQPFDWVVAVRDRGGADDLRRAPSAAPSRTSTAFTAAVESAFASALGRPIERVEAAATPGSAG